MHRSVPFFSCLVALVLLPVSVLAWSGKVVKIIDGDSVRIKGPERVWEVRLYGIDTPERRQPYSKKARSRTASLCAGKQVEVTRMDQDKYGRLVALVRLADGRLVNEELVRSGLAWVHVWFCKADFCDAWKDLEAQARKARRGLWRDPAPEPPWEWKRRHPRTRR